MFDFNFTVTSYDGDFLHIGTGKAYTVMACALPDQNDASSGQDGGNSSRTIARNNSAAFLVFCRDDTPEAITYAESLCKNLVKVSKSSAQNRATTPEKWIKMVPEHGLSEVHGNVTRMEISEDLWDHFVSRDGTATGALYSLPYVHGAHRDPSQWPAGDTAWRSPDLVRMTTEAGRHYMSTIPPSRRTDVHDTSAPVPSVASSSRV
jgi:hypothetical protein